MKPDHVSILNQWMRETYPVLLRYMLDNYHGFFTFCSEKGYLKVRTDTIEQNITRYKKFINDNEPIHVIWML